MQEDKDAQEWYLDNRSETLNCIKHRRVKFQCRINVIYIPSRSWIVGGGVADIWPGKRKQQEHVYISVDFAEEPVEKHTSEDLYQTNKQNKCCYIQCYSPSDSKFVLCVCPIVREPVVTRPSIIGWSKLNQFQPWILSQTLRGTMEACSQSLVWSGWGLNPQPLYHWTLELVHTPVGYFQWV